MFGIGWNELLVIFVVVIVFVRPKDLPKLFRQIGKLYGKLKSAYAELVSTKDQIIKNIEDEVKRRGREGRAEDGR